MRLFPRRILICALGVAAVGLGCGCSGSKDKGIKVRGKLLRNGAPAQVDITGKALPPSGEGAAPGRMRVMFYPVKADNDVIANDGGEIKEGISGHEAGVESDGTFVLIGVPPGKYRVVITHIDPSTEQDLLKGVFNEANSKITRDVTGDQEIVIDLAKPTG